MLSQGKKVVNSSGGVAYRWLSYAGGRVPPTTQNVINGQWVESAANQWIDVHNPATNDVVTRSLFPPDISVED
jgi:hypothetical protein